ncbi:MAG TPA: POTRA domain-containing protein, partial [Candidatus Kapabacteria bacterium]
MRSLLFSIFLLSISTLALAQGPGMPPEQKYVVLGITLTGNRTGDAQTVISQSGIYKGENITLPSDAIRNGILQLWNMGIFSNVSITIDKEVPQPDSSIGLFLTVHVDELSHIAKDTIIGNKEVKTEDISKAMSFREGDFVRPWELEAGKSRVKALYEKEGYHFATVTIQQEPASEPGKVNLTVFIDEGKEMVVRHIDFEGNDHVPSGDLRGAMDDTKEKKWWNIFSSGDFNELKYEDDKKKVVDYYHSKGYRDAAILNDSVWTTG